MGVLEGHVASVSGAVWDFGVGRGRAVGRVALWGGAPMRD